MIADYTFYSGEYYGKLLSAEEFPEYATRADAYLDYYTNGAISRIEAQLSGFNSDRTSSEVTEPSSSLTEANGYEACEDALAVKFAECSVAELCRQMAADSAENPSFLEKETVGSHSVAYRAASDLASSWSSRIRDVIYLYLAHTGLLYRGAILQFKL